MGSLAGRADDILVSFVDLCQPHCCVVCRQDRRILVGVVNATNDFVVIRVDKVAYGLP